MKRKIISLVLFFVMVQAYMYSIYAVTQSDLQNLKTEKKEVEEKETQITEQLDEEMQAISKLDLEISESQSQVDKLEAQISDLEKTIEEKETMIEEKQKEYVKNEDMLEQRIVVMYETGETSFLDMLVSSSSLIDFISNYYTMSQLVQFDTELLQGIEDDKKSIEQAKQELENEKQEVENLKTEKVAATNKLKSAQAQRQQKANALSDEQKMLQSQIDDYNQKIEQAEAELSRKLEEGTRQVNEAGLQFDGSFIWPCDCRIITSTVKPRWGRWHKGLDIGACYDDVYASVSGYCYPLENPGGYGYYILMVHGSGYCTLYGHLDSFNVYSGQYVNQGDVIATSGNTGSSTGPHLHFEIRRATSVSDYFSNDFLDPLDYLSGGYTFADGATVSS